MEERKMSGNGSTSSSVQALKSPACHRACRAIHAHVSRLMSSSGIIDRRSAEIKRARHAARAGPRFPGSADREHLLSLFAPGARTGSSWFLRELAPLVPLSLSCPPLKARVPSTPCLEITFEDPLTYWGP